VIVWIAALRATPGRVFRDYAILGDDIVIADSKVAQEYKKIMQDLEVTISTEKSLVSRTGAMEFAKRFISDYGTMDLSPVSFRMLNLTSGPTAAYIFQALKVSLRTSYRLRGASYRVYNHDGPIFESPNVGCGTGFLTHPLLVSLPSQLICGSFFFRTPFS
jgi:hypothetical protein